MSSLIKQYEREFELLRQSVTASKLMGHSCEPEAVLNVVSDTDNEPTWVAFNWK